MFRRKKKSAEIPAETLKRMGRYLPPEAPLKKAHPVVNPFIQLEQRLWEPLLAWANNQALLGLLGLVGNVGIIIAVFTYIGTEQQRRDAEVLNAWQTLTSAHGQSGSGGRIQALEFLNASPGANWRRKFPWVCAPLPLCTWEAESLDGINLGVETEGLKPSSQLDSSGEGESPEESPEENPVGVYLAGIQLPNARLRDANLAGADLGGANLEGANLWEANLEGANLRGVNLAGGYLWFANLAGARLLKANLEGANLEDADLGGADLWEANLEGADLEDANLEGAELWGINLKGAVLIGVDLSGVKNLTEVQLTRAKLCRTTLPDNITLDPDRDCEELRIDPDSGAELIHPPSNSA